MNWRQRREAEESAKHDARIGALMGFELVDVVHDNRTGLDYHPACSWPLEPCDTVELGALPGDKTCAHCLRVIE